MRGNTAPLGKGAACRAPVASPRPNVRPLNRRSGRLRAPRHPMTIPGGPTLRGLDARQRLAAGPRPWAYAALGTLHQTFVTADDQRALPSGHSAQGESDGSRPLKPTAVLASARGGSPPSSPRIKSGAARGFGPGCAALVFRYARRLCRRHVRDGGIAAFWSNKGMSFDDP